MGVGSSAWGGVCGGRLNGTLKDPSVEAAVADVVGGS